MTSLCFCCCFLLLLTCDPRKGRKSPLYLLAPFHRLQLSTGCQFQRPDQVKCPSDSQESKDHSLTNKLHLGCIYLPQLDSDLQAQTHVSDTGCDSLSQGIRDDSVRSQRSQLSGILLWCVCRGIAPFCILLTL